MDTIVAFITPTVQGDIAGGLPFFENQAPMDVMPSEEGLNRVIAYMQDWISKNGTGAP